MDDFEAQLDEGVLCQKKSFQNFCSLVCQIGCPSFPEHVKMRSCHPPLFYAINVRPHCLSSKAPNLLLVDFAAQPIL
jgi:hypothetical protein